MSMSHQEITLALPEELLIRILIQSALEDPNKYYFMKVSTKAANFRAFNVPNLIKIFQLNKRFLSLLANEVLPKKYYITLSINSTRYISSNFNDFIHYLKVIYNNLNLDFPLNESEFIAFISEKFKLSNHNDIKLPKFRDIYDEFQLKRSPQSVDFYKQIPGLLPYSDLEDRNKKERAIFDTIYEHFEKFRSNHLRKYKTLYFTPSKYIEKYFCLKDVFILDFHLQAKLFCELIMNNKNSIMKKFIKSFAVDLLFPDEFQTSRITKSSLLGSIIKKYHTSGNNELISVKPPPFKMFSNYLISNPNSTNINDQDQFNQILGAKSEFEKRAIKLRQVMISNDQWQFYKQRALWACFCKFFLDGERFKICQKTKKNDITTSLNDLFKIFYDDNKNLNIKRRLNPLNTLNFQSMTREQQSCFSTTNKVIESTFDMNRPFLNIYQNSDFYMSEAETESLVDELVKACTINSSPNTSTSFIAFSLKNSNEGYNDEGFEMLKPKMYVINKPAAPRNYWV